MTSFANSQVHVDRPLSNLATAYTNHRLIGTMLAPEIQVDQISGKFWRRNRANGMRFVGQPILSAMQVPPSIEQGMTLDNYSCDAYGFKGELPLLTEASADMGTDLRGQLVLDVTARLKLAQEARIASLFTTAGNYDSANVKTLVGADRFDAGGDPLGVIDELKSLIWPGENTKLVLWMGEAVWRVLKRHPALTGLVSGGATTNAPAIVLRERVAELLEVDEVLIGEAYSVTSNPGAADTTARIWGKSMGLARVADAPSTRSIQFASSFRFGPMEVTDWIEPAPGARGAWIHKVTHVTDEKVIAPDAGALVVTPIS